MKRSGERLLGLCAVLAIVMAAIAMAAIVMACKSQPPDVDQYPEEKEEKASGSFTISQEMYDSTLAEVKLFVDGLNSLILNKNYEGWKAALSDELFAQISSPEFLANASESAALKSRKIVLKTPNDYFSQVVVPSRSNSKVDEIEFTAANRVKVFFRESEARRLRLYELIKIYDTWKIID